MGRPRTYLSIGDVADIFGVSVDTIRSWERRYGWPCADRSRGAHRRYSPADEQTFRDVAHFRRFMSTPQAIARVVERRTG